MYICLFCITVANADKILMLNDAKNGLIKMYDELGVFHQDNTTIKMYQPPRICDSSTPGSNTGAISSSSTSSVTNEKMRSLFWNVFSVQASNCYE